MFIFRSSIFLLFLASAAAGCAKLESRDLIREGGGSGGFASMMGMGAMGALSELTSAGLSMNQVQVVTKEVIDYARAKAGEDVVGQIVGSIPGLDAFV